MKTTKETLVKDNARLREQNEMWERKDAKLRTELSAVLHYENGGGIYSMKYVPQDTMTWIQIAFHIGELRADANYSCLLDSREIMRTEIEHLKAELKEKKP